MMLNYLPLKAVAQINEIDPKLIYQIYSKNKKDERFKMIDGKLYVIENYKYPLADELDTLRHKALIIAHKESTLCMELSRMGNIKYQTIRKYLYRFTFKQMELAKKIISLLTIYIETNSLFPVEELRYEY